MKIPSEGTSREAILDRMRALRGGDANAAEARLFSLVYPTRPDVTDLAKEAFTAFFSENALNPMAFPSLRAMESDVIAMTLGLLHAPGGATGSMTSGGSESLLLAVKTARDWARATRPEIAAPELLLPVSAHPALFKAAHMLDVRPVAVPLRPDFGADVDAAHALASDRTILVVGSAPQYPHGVLDPIPELAAIARARGVLCHVDACFGGFMLPWVERLGRQLAPWDFRVPGVTSISADVHKYGYAAKGASTILYASRALRKHQFFVHADWPGGLFGSPGVLGTRPGGAIAAAWAVMQYLGEVGYLDLARRALAATETIASGVRSIPELEILGTPAMTALAIGRRGDTARLHDPRPDVYVLGDLMQERGWHFDRGQRPPSLHLTVSPAHDALADRFVADLREATALAKTTEQAQGKAAVYGMLGAMPDRGAVRDALLDVMDSFDAE